MNRYKQVNKCINICTFTYICIWRKAGIRDLGKTTTMELGPERESSLWFWGANSIHCSSRVYYIYIYIYIYIYLFI